MKSDIIEISEKIDVLQKAQAKLIRQIAYLMKATDETARKEAMSQMGITDGFIDLNTYSKSLEQDISDVMDINKTLRKHIADSEDIAPTDKKPCEKKSLSDDVMSGLNF